MPARRQKIASWLSLGLALAIIGGVCPGTASAGTGKLRRAQMRAEKELRLLLLEFEDALSQGKPEAALPLFREGALVTEPGRFRGSYAQYVAQILKPSRPRLRSDEWLESRVELDVDASKPSASARQSLIWWHASPQAQVTESCVFRQDWQFERVGEKWFVSSLELHRQRHPDAHPNDPVVRAHARPASRT